MLEDVRQEKEKLTNDLESVRKRLKKLDPESIEYRELYSKHYNLEREVRQDWY